MHLVAYLEHNYRDEGFHLCYLPLLSDHGELSLSRCVPVTANFRGLITAWRLHLGQK